MNKILENIFSKYFIFIIILPYISNIIIIPFQTYNPFIAKNESLLNLIKNASDKDIVNTITRNLIYSNFNIGENSQTVPTFIEMSTKKFVIIDLTIPKSNMNNGIIGISNANFTYGNNFLLKDMYEKKFYNSNKSKSYIYIGKCYELIFDLFTKQNNCGNETIYLKQKNNINEKEIHKAINISLTFKELEYYDQRPAVLGFSYYNNFISELKEKSEINGYDFSFRYTNTLEDKGELIIGDLLHIYDSKNYDENTLRTAKINKESGKLWSINFDIYISNEYHLEIDEIGSFFIEEYFMTGSYKYFEYIEKFFFKKYINEKKCGKYIHKKAYYTDNFYYFICNIEEEEKRKEFFENFPSLKLYQKEMNYNFTFNSNDLFTIIPDNKRILFNIDFIYNSKRWILGKPFFKKYQLVFNSDSNLIRHYVENIFENKEKNNKGNSFKIILIIFLVIIAFLVGIIFGRALCSKFNRKIRANELEDNFTYIAKDNNKNNDLSEFNEKSFEYKSNYYNLNT